MSKPDPFADVRTAYAQALRFGIADLNESVKEHDPLAYFRAIERHHKLTAAIRDGLESAKLLDGK
jgi:hypothetical protein